MNNKKIFMVLTYFRNFVHRQRNLVQCSAVDYKCNKAVDFHF